MGQSRLSSIAIINIEISYANRIFPESMNRITVLIILGKKNFKSSRPKVLCKKEKRRS